MTDDEDDEILAMTTVSKALKPLEADAQARVLGWAANRFGVTGIKFNAGAAGGGDGEPGGSLGSGSAGGDSGGRATYANIEEVFESGAARTQMQKALFAAYFFQVIGGSTGWQSYTLNAALKNLGIGIPNITDALSSAESQRPALVMQTSKSGKSRQARKTYKLTAAGIKYVEALLNGTSD